MSTLHRLAHALLEREILDAHEIDLVIKGQDLPPNEKKNGTPPPAAAPAEPPAPARPARK